MKKVLLKIMKEVRERIELDQDKNICSAFDSVIIKNNVLGDWRVLELHINNSGNFYNKVTELNHKKQKAFPEFYKFIKEIGEKLHNENFHIKNTSYHISDPWKTDKAGRLYYLDKFIEYLNRQIIEQEDNEKIIVPEMINKKSFIKFEQEVKLSVWKTNLFKEIYSGIKSHKETFICTALQNLLLQDKFYLELLSKSYLDEDKFFIYFKNYYLLDFMHFIQTVGQKYVDKYSSIREYKIYEPSSKWNCVRSERLKELEKFINEFIYGFYTVKEIGYLDDWRLSLYKKIYNRISSKNGVYICTTLHNLLLQDKFYLELLSKSYLDEDKFFIYFKNYYLLDFMHFIQTVGQKYVDRNQALFYSGKAKKYSLNHYWLCSHKERLKELEKFISITAHK